MKHHFFSFCLILFINVAKAQVWIENAGFSRQILLNDEGRFGYAEKIWKQEIKDARVIIPYQFDWAGPFDKAGHAVVEVNGKYGLIDTLGKYVIPSGYDYVYSFSNGYATVYKDGKFGVVNQKGNLVIPFEYEFISAFGKGGRADAVKGNKWGVINTANTEILPFQYLIARTDDKNYTRVFLNDWGYLDPAGKAALDGSYQALSHEDNGYIVGITTTLKKVLMNSKLKNVLPDDLAFYSLNKSGNACIVKKGNQYGLYDLASQKLILPAEFKYLHFNGSMVVVEQSNGAYYFTDIKGNKLFGKEFQFVTEFKDYSGFAEVKQNNKWGLMDKNGNFILKCEMGNADDINIHVDVITNRISARKGSGWGMTDLNGNLVLPFQYIDPVQPKANPFNFNGDYKVNVVMDQSSGKKGIVDNKGNWLFAPGNNTYDDFGIIDQFVSGGGVYVAVSKKGKWGVYDLVSKKEIFKLQIDDNITAGLENDHFRFLDKNDKWGLVVYKTGKVFNPGENEYEDFDEETNYLIVKKNGLYGLVDVNGKTITQIVYKVLKFDRESSYYFAIKDGMAGFIDQQGNTVIPCKYEPLPFMVPNEFVNDHVRMLFNGKSVLLDSKGKTIINSTDFLGTDDIFIIKTRFSGTNWCYMGKYKDENGKEIMKIILNGKLYENLGGDIYNSIPEKSILFNDGRLAAKRDGLYGFLDTKGNEVIPFEYDRAGSFEDGTAYVKKGGKYFKINRNGQKLRYADMRLALLAREK